jgi:hypothetical protein
MGHRGKEVFPRTAIQMDNKTMESYLTSLAVRKHKLKPQLNTPHTYQIG